jgi:hypothetical protein
VRVTGGPLDPDGRAATVRRATLLRRHRGQTAAAFGGVRAARAWPGPCWCTGVRFEISGGSSGSVAVGHLAGCGCSGATAGWLRARAVAAARAGVGSRVERSLAAGWVPSRCLPGSWRVPAGYLAGTSWRFESHLPWCMPGT